MEKLNEERAALGMAVMKHFASACRQDIAIEPETVLFDLLVCLRHAATNVGTNFDNADAAAAEFYVRSLGEVTHSAPPRVACD